MAKNELVSLGLVWSEPRHAYALNAIVKELGLEQWARISQASIYSTLARLEKDGCVELRTMKVGNMPERKVYSITARGRERLGEELRDAVGQVGPHEDPYYLAMMFGFGMNGEELAGLLEQRVASMAEGIEQMEAGRARVESQGAPHAEILIRAGVRHTEVEMEMTREMVRLLREQPDYFETQVSRMFRDMDAVEWADDGTNEDGAAG